MKFSDVPTGAYILIPCPRCGEKRSLKVPQNRDIARLRARICKQCMYDDMPDRANIREGRYKVRIVNGFRMMED